jgi:CheY-like chemotaxis protein
METKPSTLPVLVIDDDETDREIIIRHLGRAWPFEREMAVATAADGREAVEKIHATRFALIVLDWKLPVMDGGEVLRDIRKHNVRTPVVILSGLERHQITDDLPALSAAFLNKDEMTPATFRAAIAESLRLLGVTAPAPTR